MSEVIYRKYRPRNFVSVHGQVMTVQILRQAVTTQNFAHGYLFAGPRGTGKTTMARLMVKALNCLNFSKNNDVCDECEMCLSFDKGDFPDMMEIDAASNRGIDEIRLLKETINFMPVRGRFKVYIIDEVHMLTKEAFNALLKTLEEPPKHVIFILATTEPHKIPVTILSRVQRFDFQLAAKDELVGKLNKIVESEETNVEAGVLDMVYEFAEGSFRDAESILGKVISSVGKDKKITVDEVRKLLGVADSAAVERIEQALLGQNPSSVWDLLNKSESQGGDLLQLAKQLANSLRSKVIKGELPIQRRVVDVLNKLVQMQSEAKLVDDKRLLWDTLVLNVFSSDVQSTPTPIANSTSKIAEPIKQSISINNSQSASLIARKSDPVYEPLVVTEHQGFGEDDLEKKWEEFLKRLRKQDLKLWTYMTGASVVNGGGTWDIITGVSYSFEQLEKEANREKLNKVFESIYGAPVSNIKYVAGSNGVGMEGSNADLVESIL